jgi:putative membrane protein
MKKMTMKNMIKCAAVSGVLGFAASQTMAMDQQSASESKNQSKAMQNAHQNLTESQVIKVVSTANNGEIKQARTVLPKLKTEEARKYAQIMINEHSANEKKGQTLASSLKLTPQVSGISTSLQKDSDNVVRKLSNSSTPDKDYMSSQVDVHRKVLNTIEKQLIPNAKNAELKNMLTQTRTAVAKHLKMAEDIVAKMK